MITRAHWSLLALVTAAAIWLVFLRAAPTPASSNEPSSAPGKHAFRQRLIAVGDLHGDIDNAQKVLRMASIVDDKARWIGGTDILVQTGDIVDRGTYAYDVYKMMQRLRGEAHTAGGKVVSILGNHEVMNAIGDWRYVTQSDIKRFGTTDIRQRDLSVGGWLGQEWLANYSSTALVAISPYANSPTYSFTHGSLRPSFPHLLPYPDMINQLGRSLLRRALTPPLAAPYPPHPYSGLPKGSSDAELELYASGGPYWWRGLAEVEDEETVCGWAKELQEKIGARRIIGGHTPNFERIVHRCNASIIIIDTGISSAYGGVLSALEIIYTLTPIASPSHDHRQDPLRGASVGERYVEREEIHAIYERRTKTIALAEKEVVV